jgi:aminopeptidase-like protein
MKSMKRIIADLTPLNRVFCSSDYDKAIKYLLDTLPFKVIEYPASVEHNGWVIPPKWDVQEAEILKDGKIIYDGTKHPIAVIALSRSFSGRVELDELKRHLYFDKRFPDAIPFHFRQQFRSWNRDWGFCVPRQFYDSLGPGEYSVNLETGEAEGVLKILEYEHRGKRDETIVIGANLDHPGVSNDGLSGCAVGIELFRRLKNKMTKFSYRLVLVQGIIGSEYYLGMMDPAARARLMEGVFLEMLGSRTQLALQETRSRKSNFEFALAKTMAAESISFRRGAFETIIINDEYLWENYGIPMASLSRFPYPEYHCDKDDISIISEECLNEAVDVLWASIELVESSPLVKKRFKGNICLSNPKYDLYIDPGQQAFGDLPGEQIRRLRFLMDLIPAVEKGVTISALAHEAGLPEDVVQEYLKKWEEKQLLEMI